MSNPKDQTPYADRPSARAVHRAVQNVLFNEMGLSKNGVEKMIRQEVTGIADKRATKDSVMQWVMEVINRVAFTRWERDKLQKLIDEEVKKAVQAHVKREVELYLANNLTINIGAPTK